MFKKSLLVALLLSSMSVLAVSAETDDEIAVNKCDVLYDSCMTKCGDNATDECSEKCQETAEACDEANSPKIEE